MNTKRMRYLVGLGLLVVAMSALTARLITEKVRVRGHLPMEEGNETHREVPVSPFTSVEFHGMFEVHLQPGDAPALRLEGPAWQLEELDITQTEGRLLIRENDALQKQERRDVDIYLTYTPLLEEILLNGAGAFSADTPIRVDRLNLRIKGVYHVNLPVEATEEVSIEQKGVGHVELRGRAPRVIIHAEGVGGVDAAELKAREAVVTAKGIGDVSVHADEALTISAFGLGKVTYTGNPAKLDIRQSGLGTVSSR